LAIEKRIIINNNPQKMYVTIFTYKWVDEMSKMKVDRCVLWIRRGRILFVYVLTKSSSAKKAEESCGPRVRSLYPMLSSKGGLTFGMILKLFPMIL